MAQPTQNRRLSAILFADIQGYTSLMGKNEAQALVLLDKFKQTLQAQISINKGEIINWYGDGCLAIFNSSVDAVNCAKKAQESFHKEPVVPVRIGIHSGDIVLKDSSIFGDAVNVTSRIESMGIPGSVLLSHNVRNQIKNKPELELKALGSFFFKNVEEPVKVYALANAGFSIPAKITGKLKQPGSALPKQSSNPIRIGLIGIIFLLSGFLVWKQFFNNKSQLLPQEIRKARIAILPFENKTGDESLDVLGEMASDWIVQGMLNMDDFKVVSSATVREHLPVLQMKAEGRQSFQRNTGAEKIIRGSFYPDDDILIFQTQIIDAATGEFEFAFPEVSGNASDKVELVKEIRERVLSYFMMKSLNEKKGEYWILENPPKYEAFKKQMAGESFFGPDYPKAIQSFQEAVEIDSAYLAPYYWIVTAYSNQGRLEEADSMFRLIEERFPSLQPFEQLTVNWLKTMLDGDLEGSYKAIKKINEKDPKLLGINYLTGLDASDINRPNAAVEIYRQVEEIYKESTYDNNTSSWWNSVYASNLIRLDRLDKAMEVLNFVPMEKASNGIFYRKQEIYILRNQSDSLLQMIKELEAQNFPIGLIHGLYAEAIEEFAIIGDADNQKKWATMAIKIIKDKPESIELDKVNLSHAYFFNEQYEKAMLLYQERNATYGPSAFRLMRIGSCLAKLGRADEAKAIIEEIKSLEPARHWGEYAYNIAKVYSMLGEKEQAMDYIRQAYQEGHRFSRESFPAAIEFLPLKGYSPYEEFIRPKG